MENKITVVEFVNEFKEKKIMNTKFEPDAVEKFILAKIELKTYIPFVDKRELCARVLEASCTKNGSLVEVDSVSRYILFTISMLTHYTNLDFENNDGLDNIEVYDLLCESDLLNPILGCIGSEYTVCNNMLNMMTGDIMANNSVTTVLNEAAIKLLDIVDDFANVLAEKVEGLNFDLSKFDINKLKGLLDKYKIMK